RGRAPGGGVLTKLLYFLRSALGGFRQSPFIHAVAALTIAVAVLVTGIARFALSAAERVLAAWGEDVELTLFLRPEVSEAQARALAEKLAREEGASAEFVSADVALERLRGELGSAGDVLQDLPKNPLSHTLEVKPAAGLQGARAVHALAEAWTLLPEVESVEYGREWVDRLERLTNESRHAGLFLFAAIVIAAVVVAAATLQLGIYARREEIEIQKLVGATDAFVRAPFLIEGLLQGVLGAAVAVAALLTIESYLGPAVSSAFRFAAGSVGGLQLVDATGAALLLGLGAVLGFVGSLLAVGRFLRV
ncbi:MAG: cell division protein FtsX, partial [Myxococcales bacterium]